MGRRKIGHEKIRSIQKSNGSYIVSLPIDIVRELGWQEHQRIVIERYGAGKLLISDYNPKS
jgi:hypothetical protein